MVEITAMSDEEEVKEKEEEELDLSSPDVVTKYKAAAEIVNKALQLVVSECKPKAKVVDLCEKGDAFIREQSGNMYKNVKKKIERGVAFPTCISVNNTVCHFSPHWSDETVLEANDIVKIDMGCHIDGFIAVVAHTHVIQEGAVTGRAADVIAAASTAAEVALRLVRPGKKNKDVMEAIQKVAVAYDCKSVEGFLSHQLKQFVIDGNKVILSVANPETRVDDTEFEENEVYVVDIVTSTGEGKPKLLDEKQTTIYKRAVDQNYHLKMKSSRFIFSEINQKFPIMPFTARALDEKRARLGLVECVNHDLLQPYPVLHEKPGDIVAHIKFTVLLMPNGSDRITSHQLQELQPTKTIDDQDIKAWLALGTNTKKKGGGKKKKEGEMDPRGFVQYSDATGHVFFLDSSVGNHCSTESEAPIGEATRYSSPIFGQPASTSKKSRTANFSIEEDKLLISAWLNVSMDAVQSNLSMDAVQGNEQKVPRYWHRVWEYFHKYKKFNSDRNANSLMHRWSTIQLATNKFCRCYAQIEARNQSGINEQDKFIEAKMLYTSLHGTSFQFEHCWHVLRYQSKWMEDCQKKKTSKKCRPTASPCSSSPSTSDAINLGDNEDCEIIERPPGRKAEKEHRKHKGKGYADEESNTTSITTILKEIREEKKVMNERKFEMYEKMYQQEQERIANEQEKIRLKEQLEDERIILIDTSQMSSIQAEYYRRRQMEILSRGRPSG